MYPANHLRPLKFLSLLSLPLCCIALAGQASGKENSAPAQGVKAEFLKDALVITLPLAKPAASATSARVKVELLNPEDKVRASTENNIELAPGQAQVVVRLEKPFVSVPSAEMKELNWLRLRYEIRARPGEMLAEGIEALRTEATDPFLLRATAPYAIWNGRDYEMTVLARTDDDRPLGDVRVVAKITLEADEGEKEVSASGITDRHGRATLRLKLPSGLPTNEAELEVHAVRGLVVRTAQSRIFIGDATYLLLGTDKEIYQPGQTLHARLLRFDGQRKASPKEPLDVRITDEASTLISHQTVTTDAFGVANLEWLIPPSLAQGDYRIRAKSGPPAQEGGVAYADKHVHIYRYELPNFRVLVGPDRSYYLPGQNASVTVSAEYLFGKPVIRGKVRVVEEEERRWDFSEQKWNATEGQEQGGELGADGKFSARFNLSKHHEGMADQSYRRFREARFAAYVTDLTTGHTEQRRFNVRVTREPIHVYAQQTGLASGEAPLTYYISTFYADGTPARCRVQLSSYQEDVQDAARHRFGEVETNGFGLAKITGIRLPNSDDDRVLFEAMDATGRYGHADERVDWTPWINLEMSTQHAIYRPGEPLEVTLRGLRPADRFNVAVVRDWTVLDQQTVTMKHGRAFVAFPYDPRFSDEVSVVAYSLQGRLDGRQVGGLRTVLYPKNRKLEVGVGVDRDVHRPGDAASARFSVRLPDGSSTGSVLGVKVVDQAVEERARTDNDFGQGNPWLWWHWSLWASDGGFGAISRDDLDRVNLDEPIPADLDLVAEFILRDSRSAMEVFENRDELPVSEIFSRSITQQLQVLVNGLEAWNLHGKQPHSETELVGLGKEFGVDVASLRDPWGTPYRYELAFHGDEHTFTAYSAGPDKQFGTDDDFVAHKSSRKYFAHYGGLLRQAALELLAREGRYIRDLPTLQAEMLTRGVDVSALRDPWGEPYEIRFLVERSTYLTQFVSHGEYAKRINNAESVVWQDQVDFFLSARQQIEGLMAAHLRDGKPYPESSEELKAILRQAGVDLDVLVDPWGSHYFLALKDVSQYGDRVTMEQTKVEGSQTSQPVTLVRKELRLMSAGRDRQPGTKDDFDVAKYSIMVAQQSAADILPVPLPIPLIMLADRGAVTGTVLDPNGLAIPNANLTATLEGTKVRVTAESGSTGQFLLNDLRPGIYTVTVEAAGFKKVVTAGVHVQAGNITQLKFQLALGARTEVVTVEASAPAVETSSAMLSSKAEASSPRQPAGEKPGAMSTPRLRQEFPETMLWEPAVVTDRHGHARLNFKFADNITTWKLTAVASTKNGELGKAEMDLRVFQPFFVEHDPPKVLTEGDEISYPLVLRNYLDRAQTLRAAMKPESWFTLLGPAEMQVRVEAGDAARAVFLYRTIASVAAGKQQVSAANGEISDAALKPVDVHPFGSPTAATATEVVTGQGSLLLHIPEASIAGSVRSRVKVYPNLLAHLVENLEAGLERPHGCGEQTISSTYPSLLVAEFYAKEDRKPAVAQKAQRYLQAGYERLLGYQDDSGGFTYWGRGKPDLSLTAYALEFLLHASHHIQIDETVAGRAAEWVLKQQGKDGAWRNPWNHDEADAGFETAYIVQVLSLAMKDDRGSNKAETVQELRPSVDRALAFLAARQQLLSEPYAIASYALASRATGDQQKAEELAAVLRKSARVENGTTYWALERNTPFYGWGRTGRLESTALALRALTQNGAVRSDDQELVRHGMLFLIHEQEKDGMWYSGQTTVQVLKTLLGLVGRDQRAGAKLSLRVNGQDAGTLDLPDGKEVAAPLEADVTRFVHPGENRLELATSSTSVMSTQFIAESYVDWDRALAAPASAATNATATLKYAVSYSTTQTTTGTVVECRVHAERVGFRGYGMMLAEAGLPPGVDVDRESLERAVRKSDSVYRYEVSPDRVILYVWPSAGGSDFTFQFKPRFAMKAQTAPSKLYDYYNPDASVTVKPALFAVAEGKEGTTTARK